MQPLEGLKVLVIDDEQEVASILSKRFNESGAETVNARTHADALVALTKEKPDIALIDLDLGGDSGMELIRAIKSLPEPHPLLAILTNSTNVMDVADAVDLDVTTFIQKADHDPHEIVDIVAQLYSQKHRDAEESANG